MANRAPSVNRTVSVQIRRGTRPLDARLLRRVFCFLLTDLLQLESFDLLVSVVSAPEMAELNEKFLQHQGPTDVLAFDYGDRKDKHVLLGEIVVCKDEAVRQARRFRTCWQSELVRYLAHGTLHLLGYDDHGQSQRLKMKQQENRLLRQLTKTFDLANLG